VFFYEKDGIKPTFDPFAREGGGHISKGAETFSRECFSLSQIKQASAPHNGFELGLK